MIKIEHLETHGWGAAIRGMRNPLESWDKSDSFSDKGRFFIGDSDLKLATKLANAGADHGKFLRMIHIQCDIVAPDFWWKEYATYKVATTENSTSTMHKLGSRALSRSDFTSISEERLAELNSLILLWRETHDSDTWRELIESLPMGYLYRRTCDLNYQVLRNMYHARKTHKLREWRVFLEVMEDCLPYFQELIKGAVK